MSLPGNSPPPHRAARGRLPCDNIDLGSLVTFPFRGPYSRNTNVSRSDKVLIF